MGSVPSLSPPSRRMQGDSTYGMCVMSGCRERAVALKDFRLSGQLRTGPVCRRHV